MTTALGFADQSIGKTYRRIRYLVALALISLPLLTALAGKLYGHELQDSLLVTTTSWSKMEAFPEQSL